MGVTVDLATLLKEIRVARLQPGDVVLARVEGRQDDGTLEYIRRRLEQAFTGHRVVILDGVDLEIVRPEDDRCAYGHIRSWGSDKCVVCGELRDDPPPALLVADPDMMTEPPMAGT